jgi:hypothetical protein
MLGAIRLLFDVFLELRWERRREEEIFASLD